MNIKKHCILLISLAATLPFSAKAALNVYADPTVSNQSLWNAAVSVVGTHDFGGATVSGTTVSSTSNTIISGPGPGQGNTSSGTARIGEGESTSVDNYLFMAAETLTISVSGGTSAIGFEIIDLFTSNTFTATVRDTSNSIIGTFAKTDDSNFQTNNIIFCWGN